jgi:hypothetical protein
MSDEVSTEIFSDKTRAHYGEHLHRIGDAVGAAVLAMDEQDMDGYDAAMTVVHNTLSRLRNHRLADFDDVDDVDAVSAYPANSAYGKPDFAVDGAGTVTIEVYAVPANSLLANLVRGR